MTDFTPEQKARLAIEVIAQERERERILSIVRAEKGRFIKRDWLIRQIEKGD